MNNRYTIGIDVGGTNIRAGIVYDHDILKEVTEKTPDNLAGLKEALNQVCWQLNQDYDYVLKRGVALPGLIDHDKKSIVMSPNMQFLNGISFSQILDNAAVGNDVDMALLGEIKYNPELIKQNVMLINIGTGIGGAVYLKGIGSWDLNMPVEIGHMVIMPGGRTCGCGNNGCLEAYFSGTALLKQAKEKVSGDIESVEDFFELVGSNNDKAEKVADEGAVALGVSLASLANIFGIDTFLIGGKIGNSYDLFIKKAYLIAQKHLFGKKEFLVQKAALIDKGGIMGAASFAQS